MARILHSNFGFGINLDGNIGPRGGNERSDVGIVQFALRILTEGAVTPLGREIAQLNVPGARGTIAVDGFFGPQTAAFIQAYQAVRVRSPAPSLAQLPRPDGNFGSARVTAWNFGLLEGDIGSATRSSVIELLSRDSRAPPFLKPFFLAQ